MLRVVLAGAGLLAAASLLAQENDGVESKIYGSIGSEAAATPQNGKSPLNPGGFLKIPLWADSSDVTVSGDFAAADKRWKIHFKLRGEDDWRGFNGYHGEVNELYLNWSVTRWMDFSIGRKIDKWGTGYGWNPTGVVNPLKDPRDPNDRREAFKGVDQASIDLFVKGWNVTGMIVPFIPWTGAPANQPVPLGWAARIYRLVYNTDVSVTASGGSGLPDSQGVSVSRVFGRALELHAEAASFHNTVRLAPGAGSFEFSRGSHVKALIGGQYTFPNHLNLTLEYYHNGSNLSASEWNQYRRYVDQGAADLALGNPLTLSLAAQQYSALSMGRDYAFLRAAWPLKAQKFDAETIVIASLRDGSSVIRPGLYWKVTPILTVYCLESEFIGSHRSEIGYVPIRRETDFGFRFHF
jgi:hypothetical protein